MAKKKVAPKCLSTNSALFLGGVNGIDVIALEGRPVKCFAFINRSDSDYIQVVTHEPRLQSALELASAKNENVEVEFTEIFGEKTLLRVRLLG